MVLDFLSEPETLVEINPRVAAPFFARRAPDGSETVGAHRRELVRRPKAEGTLRVLFLGASSVEGFPLPRNLTAAEFLERMLQLSLPDHRVEVINLGITAVASFPVRVLGERAIAELEPDLVLVYAGHNEMFGAAGVASQQSLGRSPRAMRGMYFVRRTGLGQLLQSLVQPSPQDHGEQRRHLIEMMAGVERIEPNGRLHRAAVSNLVDNLEGMVAAARRAEVPIVLSTLVSLEKGLHPIASWEAEDSGVVAESEVQAWGERLESEPEVVLQQAERWAGQWPRHAGVVYLEAQALDQLGRVAEAAVAYGRARDLDAMPWRAPQDRNVAIQELASRLGVPLNRADQRFAAEAGGATDWQFFYDHVHPSLRGQDLLARSFFRTLADQQLLPIPPASAARLPKWHALARQLRAHPLEGYAALHKMKTLFETPPMSHRNAAAALRIADVLDAQAATWDPIDRSAVDLWRRLSTDAGFTVPISYPAARAALALGEPQWARSYAAAAVANSYPWSDQYLNARLVELEAWAFELGLGAEDSRRILRELHDELEVVRRTPGQPTPLLAAVAARISTLDGVDDDSAWREAESLETRAPRWVRPFLEVLPPREFYRRLVASSKPGSAESSGPTESSGPAD